jgi:hypothetical protein
MRCSLAATRCSGLSSAAFSGESSTTPSTSCWGATSPNYAISYTPGTVTINRKAIAITATSQTVTYGDTTTTLLRAP